MLLHTPGIGQSRNSSIKAVEKIIVLWESALMMKAAITMLKSDLMKYILNNSIAISSTHFDILTSIEAKTQVLTCVQKAINTTTNHLNLPDKISVVKLNELKK
jgi:hypothetical protein